MQKSTLTVLLAMSQPNESFSYHPYNPRVEHYTLLFDQPVPFQHIGADIIAANITVSNNEVWSVQ